MIESWILAHVERGSASIWSAGGDWHSEERETYIREGDDLQVMCDETPEIALMMERADVFRVLFTGISFIHEPGYWDLDYGYVFPSAYIEYGDFQIVDAKFEYQNAPN